MRFMNRFSWISFGLILCSFLCLSCSSPKWFLCTSSGIITYNKNTGQFEALWENETMPFKIVADSVYVKQEQK